MAQITITITLNTADSLDAEMLQRLMGAPAPTPAPAIAAQPEQAPADEPPEFDASGLPWDGRIHSESRALVADGTWRKRRGVDAEIVKQVEAELRGALVGEVPQDAGLRGCPASSYITDESAFAPQGAPAPTLPPPPPPALEVAPPAPPAPPAAPAPQGRTIADLSAAVAAGRIELPELLEMAQRQGAKDIISLSTNPAALAAVLAHYEAAGAFQ